MRYSTNLQRIARQCQRGVAAIEFALVMLFVMGPVIAFTIEVARVMYLYNTMEEVTRRAARLATVTWTTDADKDAIQQAALFNNQSLPAGAEIKKANIDIEYLDINGNRVTKLPDSPGDNLSACADSGRVTECIYTVEVSITDVSYQPMFLQFLGWGSIDLGTHRVRMHAESLGFDN